MTRTGCSIATSAIYKIEDEEKPRKISVDELIALATVFDTSIEDLLTPVEIVDHQRAQDLLKRFDEAEDELTEAVSKMMNALTDLLDKRVFEKDIYDYAEGHVFTGKQTDDQDTPIFTIIDESGKPLPGVDDTIIREAVLNLTQAMIEQAGQIAEYTAARSVREGWKPQIEVDHGER